MSTDIKLSKTQISNIIQSGGSFGSWLGNLGKKALTNIAIPLARNNLSGLVSNLTSNAINKIEIKISGKRAIRAGKGYAFFTSNEDMNDIIKIIKSLEDSGVLIDGVTETVKHEIKKQEGGFLGALLAPLATSLVQPVISSVVKDISGRGVRRAGRGYMESIMCGFYCIRFHRILDYTNLLSPNDDKKNDKIIYKYFKDKYVSRSKYRV